MTTKEIADTIRTRGRQVSTCGDIRTMKASTYIFNQKLITIIENKKQETTEIYFNVPNIEDAVNALLYGIHPNDEPAGINKTLEEKLKVL